VNGRVTELRRKGAPAPYPSTVSDLEASVRRAVSDLPVVVVWLFGSTARGEQRADSDTDLAVLVDPSATLLQDELDRQMLGEHAAGRR